MNTAQRLRKENIAEYILYLWQLEDLFRALQFSPEAIFSQLVAPRTDISEDDKMVVLNWYMEYIELLRREDKESKGHLSHTLHLIGDLHNLHLQLEKLPVGLRYRSVYAPLQEVMPDLKALLSNEDSEMTDTELCFRALYASLLYRLKGEGTKSGVSDTIEYISPVIAELSSMYGKVERGEVDLFEGTK